MEYYLTDNIFIRNKETFIKDNKNEKKITKKNWHKYLQNYGWCKLEIGWKKRLKEIDSSNSCFGLLECGSDGDCLFHVLCEGLNSNNLINLKLPKYTVSNLRQLVANQITKDNFDIILESYRIEFDVDEFNGEWNPHSIECIQQLKNEICKCGNNFWGDHILLQLLQKKLKLNIIIFNSENYFVSDDRFKINSTASNDFENYDKTIMIYFSDNIHFQLIGYFNGSLMETLFYKKEIPKVVLDVYNTDCRN